MLYVLRSVFLKYFENGKCIEIADIEDFNLDQTFNCGQCFRWNKLEDNSFVGIAFGKEIKLLRQNNSIIINNMSLAEFEKLWLNYFDLNTDYCKIKNDLSSLDSILKTAADFAPGIRILNQDPWETLCSFIISQNNNIPRIKLIIKRLCENFGNKIGDDAFSFPSVKIISSLTENDLIPIKCGFRARYIIDAAKKVNCNFIDFSTLKSAPLDEARKMLMQITGVGPKVAECTLLYGFHRLDAFPLDVWMKRAMEVLFPGKKFDFFGKYAGIAQQYIFHYSRMNPHLFD